MVNNFVKVRLIVLVAAVVQAAVVARPLPAQSVFDSWLKPRSPPRPSQSSAPHPSVVRIIVQEKDGVAYGSGTLIDVRDQHGLVVTNWHVVRDASGEITVVFPDGFRSAARVLKVDNNWDLAALVIWRPNVQPVPVSTIAPRPGDTLTIAGYGSGNYRAVTGRCTQYVAPGTNQPYEMVELSAQARQGDSGGPIFNDRGELAGVLFGASRGTTSGSYAGRVRWFLASLAPELGHPDTAVVASRPQPQVASPPINFGVQTQPKAEALASSSPPTYSTAESFGDAGRVSEAYPVQSSPPQAYSVTEPRSAPRLPFQQSPIFETTETSTFTAADANTLTAPTSQPPQPDEFDVTTLIGNTPLEKAKAVLAVIGLMAVLLQVARVFGKS
jgi:hypothetical protein